MRGRSFRRARTEVGLATGHDGQAWGGREERSHSAVESRADGIPAAAVALGAPQDIDMGSRALHVRWQYPKDVGGSAATHRWAIEVERRSCPTSRIQGRQDTAAGLGRVCCNRSGRRLGEVVLVGLDVRLGGRGKARAAAVGCKQSVVVRRGSSKCERAVREAAAVTAAACDARASVMADRCTNPAVDVSPQGLFRPSHASVNRKSICSDRRQDHDVSSIEVFDCRSGEYDSREII